MSRKRGALSTEEENFITASASSMSIEAIAEHLNRTVGPVRKFCNNNHITYKGMTDEIYDDTILRGKLVETPYWPEVKKQLTDEELEYFVVT